MLNHQAVKDTARIVYKNNAAQQDLEMTFRPAVLPLNEFGQP